MRQLKYYVACSVDGFIARKDGTFDFCLSDGEHFADLINAYPETIPTHLRNTLNVNAENRSFDIVLMGRKTYEVGLKEGVTSPYAHLQQYLFSRSMTESPDRDVNLVQEDPLAYVRELKAAQGRDIWLCGGAELAAKVFPEIDELILKVNPVLIGAGIPIFAGEVETTQLRLVSSVTYPNGFILSKYRRAGEVIEPALPAEIANAPEA